MIEALLGVVLALGGMLLLALRSLASTKAKNNELRRDAATRKEYADAVEKSHAGSEPWHDRLRGDNNKRGM